MYKIPELLAPAGTLKSIRAAINGGADAVYFGGKAFNARRNAGNMDETEMSEAVALCRQYGIKVYVTLNILIKDEEFEDLVNDLNFLTGLSIDGLIVQDPGLIFLLQKYFPDFRLQTSTQESVYGLEGTLFFEKLGFMRVVLPREMPLGEAAMIAENTEVEVKLFCHGALCYAYSGQCLMSSMIGGRSGNRGLCAQPCRKKYELRNAEHRLIKKGYLLSMKDLNIRDRLEQVAAAGIDSLKIEGRMKSPEYVYAVTRAYRDALDAVEGKGRTPSITEKELAQVFNRSFTSGRLFCDLQVINDVVGRNRGTLAGRVIGCEGGKILIEAMPDTVFSVGDGLSFGEDAEKGMRIDALFDLKGRPLTTEKPGIKIKAPCRFKVETNTPVYRNHDARLTRRLELESRASEPVEQPHVSFRLRLSLGQPTEISATAGTYTVNRISHITPTAAQKLPLTDEGLSGQLKRLGGTGYQFGSLDADIEPGIFLSKGELNALRREIVEALDTERAEKKPVGPAPIVFSLDRELPVKQEVQKPLLSLESAAAEDFETLCDLAVDELVLPVRDLSRPQDCRKSIARARECGKRVLLTFPRVMNSAASARLKANLKAFCELGHDGFLLKNYEVLNLFQDLPVYKEADQSFNLFNALAMKQLKAWKVDGGVLSPELSAAEAAEMAARSAICCVLPVYGRQEIMVSANCVYNCADRQCGGCQRNQGWAVLTDERGASFPLRKDYDNTIHIYNGDVLLLKEELKRQKYIDKWRIYATDEAPRTLETVADYYRNALDKGVFGPLPGGAGVRYTKGNFKRGVK
ncbi:U32 family peptidase [Eubacterium sp. 1001713B170207_170306_E7]|uniref:U32 family peptidase n=1 Tax=Eubacterium sp. 1001713B170207_170306_E7 TaxID=2787097 RepID=UPI0018985FAA|nr:U32 family peptidase [Eubacterium sp. 1001713B170207_170306_E7]